MSEHTEAQDNLWESKLFFHQVKPRDQIQVIGFGWSQDFYPLSHLSAAPIISEENYLIYSWK